jgi:5-methyltetrahydrofolate--homocysteine methyltransferase
MSGFLHSLRSSRVLLMDGAMGTELLRAGLRLGEAGVVWNLTRPGEVLARHRAYRQAGARVLVTNTFQANPRALQGQAGRLEEIYQAGVSLARSAAGADGFVLADVGPILQLGSMREIADLQCLGPLLSSLSGVDAVLFETWSSPRALEAVQDHPTNWPPILLSLAYRRDQTGALVTWSGHAPEYFAREAAARGVAALGVNCGRDIGMAEVGEIVRRYRTETDLPLFARSNAGEAPNLRTPAEMAVHLPQLLAAGVAMVGGCCGTTPEHIAAFRPIVEAWNAQQTVVSSDP